MAEGQPAMTDDICKACNGSWPHPDHHVIDLGLSKVYLHDDQFFPGWTVVVFTRHATELFQLAPTERIQLMEEVSLVAKSLAQIYKARKINYELLGNQIPHIHWHLIPRSAQDPAPGEPVWLIPHKPVRLAPDAIQPRAQEIHAILNGETRLFSPPPK